MARPLTADTHDQLSGRCARLGEEEEEIQKTLIHDRQETMTRDATRLLRSWREEITVDCLSALTLDSRP